MIDTMCYGLERFNPVKLAISDRFRAIPLEYSEACHDALHLRRRPGVVTTGGWDAALGQGSGGAGDRHDAGLLKISDGWGKPSNRFTGLLKVRREGGCPFSRAHFCVANG